MQPKELVVAGGVTEIFGRMSTGRTSLLVACLSDITRRGSIVALVDTDHVFDPRGAARAGVELSRVLWVRCGHRPDRALRAADLLVRCPGFTLVALDTGALTPRLPLAAVYRLKLAVVRARTALVIVARHRIMAAGATLALETSRHGCQWAGPRPAPTRLEGAGTTVAVVRAAGRAVNAHPGAVHRAWWQA